MFLGVPIGVNHRKSLYINDLRNRLARELYTQLGDQLGQPVDNATEGDS